MSALDFCFCPGLPCLRRRPGPAAAAAEATGKERPKPPASGKEEVPPEEDKDARQRAYSFNPLQSVKDVSVGDQYFKNHKYRAAELRYTSATKWNEGNADAWLKLGEVEERLKDSEKARQAYQKYLELAADRQEGAGNPQETGKAEIASYRGSGRRASSRSEAIFQPAASFCITGSSGTRIASPGEPNCTLAASTSATSGVRKRTVSTARLGRVTSDHGSSAPGPSAHPDPAASASRCPSGVNSLAALAASQQPLSAATTCSMAARSPASLAHPTAAAASSAQIRPTFIAAPSRNRFYRVLDARMPRQQPRAHIFFSSGPVRYD